MGQFGVRVSNGSDSSNTIVVNGPDVWWAQADAGETATPGGWVRIFGKCLDFRTYAGGVRGAPASEVRLKAADGKTLPLKIQHADCYGLTADVSAETPPEKYTVQIHNGYTGEEGWRDAGVVVVAPRTVWPAEVFNVMDFYGERAQAESKRSWEFNDWATDVPGCTREDKFGIDRTEAIQAALQKAAKNGGGIIFFPIGRYRFCGGTLKIPPHTTLKGEGMNSAWFYWDRNVAVPDPMVSGDDFALQDMTFYFPMEFKMGIIVPATSRRFVMQRVRLRVFDQSHEWDKPITED
jgi:hypothetical protein